MVAELSVITGSGPGSPRGHPAWGGGSNRMKFQAVKYSVLILLLCLSLTNTAIAQSTLTQQQYEADFDYLWQNISDDYAYFDKKATDWKRVREIYRPRISSVRTNGDFIQFIEAVLE